MPKFNPTNYPIVTPKLADTLLLRQASTGDIKSAYVSAVSGAASPQQTVATVGDLRDLPVSDLANGTPAMTLGYYAAGDGGGNFFIYSEASVLADNGGTIIAAADNVGRWLAVNLYSKVDVRQFGAVGDGTTDDSAAIIAAWGFVKARTAPYQVGDSTYYGLNDGGSRSLFFSPGVYPMSEGLTHNGAVDALTVSIEAVPSSAKIVLSTGITFLTATAVISELNLYGITTQGGAGAIWSTQAGVNVQRHMRVEKCSFFGYSVCAVADEGSDFPYWRVKDNFFVGLDASNCIGLALNGLNDNSCIEDNSFLQDKYHVKLLCVSNVLIKNNDFLRYSQTSPIGTADVWLVPASGSTNLGDNTVFTSNKFGNENLIANQFRVLIADTGSGTNWRNTQHATTLSSKAVIGLKFLENNFVGNDTWKNGTAAYIHSYCPFLENVEFSNSIQGSLADYIIYHHFTPLNNPFTTRNSVQLLSVENASNVISPALCNYPGQGWVLDPLKNYVGNSDSLDIFGVTDNGTSWLRDGTASADTIFSITESNVADSQGNTAAARELTFTLGNGSLNWNLSTVTPGRLAWLEVDVKVGSSLALRNIILAIGYNDIYQARWKFNIPAVWQTIRLPFIPTVDPVSINLSTSDYSAGVRTKVQVGRIRAYHANAPQTSGTTRLNALAINDGVTAPTAVTGRAFIYVDTSDGSLKVRFGNNTTKTITTNP